MTIDQLMDMLSTVWAFTHGVVHGEIIALQTQSATGMGDMEWREAAGPLVLQMIEHEEHSYFRRIVVEAEDFPTPDVTFERRLGYVLDGLAVGLGLEKSAEPPPSLPAPLPRGAGEGGGSADRVIS